MKNRFLFALALILAVPAQGITPGAVPNIRGLLQATQAQPGEPTSMMLAAKSRALRLSPPCPSEIRGGVGLAGPARGKAGDPITVTLELPGSMTLAQGARVHWELSSFLLPELERTTDGTSLTFVYETKGNHSMFAVADVRVGALRCSVGGRMTIGVSDGDEHIKVKVTCTPATVETGDSVTCVASYETGFATLHNGYWEWPHFCARTDGAFTTCALVEQGVHVVEAIYRAQGSNDECRGFGLCSAKGSTIFEVFAVTDTPENTGEAPPAVEPAPPATKPADLERLELLRLILEELSSLNRSLAQALEVSSNG